MSIFLKDHVIAIQRKKSNLSIGLAENAETERTVVRVNHALQQGDQDWLVCYDADGVRVLVDPATTQFEDLGPARGGWGSW